MKSIKTIFKIVIFIIVITGCRSDRHSGSGEIIFNVDSIPTVETAGNGIAIPDISESLGKAHGICMVNDSIAAVLQNSSEEVLLVNIHTGKSQVAIRKGEAPLDMLWATSMSVDPEGKLWITGGMDRKVMNASWNPDGEEAVTDLVFRSSQDILRGVTDGKGGIVGLPATADSVRVIHMDDKGNTIRSFGSFPKTEMPDSVKPNNYIFQSDIAYSSSNRKAVVSNMSWNQIGIYSEIGEKNIEMSADINDNIHIETIANGSVSMSMPKPLWLMYSQVRAYESSFMVGYIGVEVRSDSDMDRNIKYILEFDWNGKPLRKYSFEREIISFDLDEKNGILYTIEDNPDPIIMKYEFNK